MFIPIFSLMKNETPQKLILLVLKELKTQGSKEISKVFL